MQEHRRGITTRHAMDPVTGGIIASAALAAMALTLAGLVFHDDMRRKRDRNRSPGAGE